MRFESRYTPEISLEMRVLVWDENPSESQPSLLTSSWTTWIGHDSTDDVALTGEILDGSEVSQKPLSRVATVWIELKPQISSRGVERWSVVITSQISQQMAGTRRAVIYFQVIRVACVKRLELDFHLVTTGNGDAPRTALVVGVVVWVVWTREVPWVAINVSGWTTCKARKETIASLSGCQKLWMVQSSKYNSLQSKVLRPVLRSPILLIPNQLEIFYRFFFFLLVRKSKVHFPYLLKSNV